MYPRGLAVIRFQKEYIGLKPGTNDPFESHFPKVLFVAPLFALLTACTRIVFYGGRTLRPVPAIFISIFSLLSWLIHVDAWYDIGTMVKWKSESALPVLLAFVFPWRTMMVLGSVAGAM